MSGLSHTDKLPTLERLQVKIHFTFNEGDGVQHDGTHDFNDLNSAKREALLALAQGLQEEVRTSGEIVGAVAGIGADGQPVFSIRMHVVIEDCERLP